MAAYTAVIGTYTKSTPGTQGTHTVYREQDQRVIGYVWSARSEDGWYARYWSADARNQAVYVTCDDAIRALRDGD